jgi:hypothetical protein
MAKSTGAIDKECQGYFRYRVRRGGRGPKRINGRPRASKSDVLGHDAGGVWS